MRTRASLLLALVALLATSLAPAAADAATPRQIKKRTRLLTFDTCASLVDYARRYAPRVDQYYAGDARTGGGFSGPPAPLPPSSPDTTTGAPGAGGDASGAPSPQPTTEGGGATPEDTSNTNVQEQGVDEPDTVKTDGKTLFAVNGAKLHAVDARSAEPKLLGSVDLEGYGQEMLLHKGRILVISYDSFPIAQPSTGAAAGLPYWQGATKLTEIDVRDPAAMKIVATQTVEGDYRSARLNGDSARIVTASNPRALYPGAPETAQNLPAAWVPSSVLERKATGAKAQKRLVNCKNVRRPRVFSGLDMLTVLTVDLSKGLPAVDADSLMTSADTVYASTGSMYIATQKWMPPADPQALPPKTTTAVHRFDIATENETTYKSSGELPGYLMSQWSLSEYKGVLRAATTESPQWWQGQQIGESESFVSTLKETSGALAPVGRVGGLGKGERIYAVRFIDDVGFVVTFRQVDPLYTVDLTNPAEPKVLGELKIAGYSAYLHPVGKDLLLGVGQDATEEGRRLGTQVSLFDVSDLRRPQRVQQASLGGQSSSQAEFDHHAFLYWAKTKLAVIPVSIYGSNGTPPFYGAIGFNVDAGDGINEVGRIEHPELQTNYGYTYKPQVDRSVVVGNRILTVSEGGVAANDLNAFGPLGFAAFPQPPAEDPPTGGPTPAPDGPVSSPTAPAPGPRR